MNLENRRRVMMQGGGGPEVIDLLPILISYGGVLQEDGSVRINSGTCHFWSNNVMSIPLLAGKRYKLTYEFRDATLYGLIMVSAPQTAGGPIKRKTAGPSEWIQQEVTTTADCIGVQQAYMAVSQVYIRNAKIEEI